MNKIKPYWFLESPLDTEHKYYVLMDILVKTKKSLNRSTFAKNFTRILNIQKDLIHFDKESELTPRTMMSMTDDEKNVFYNYLDKNLDNINEITSIVKNSIEVIDNFIKENKELEEKYNSLVRVESYCTNYNLWDQGFIVIKKDQEKNMRIFSWFFSIVEISGKENVALLMTEVLDPLCETTGDIKLIRKFLKDNIKDYSYKFDCIIIGTISPKVDIETGTDITKEKSIDMIINNFKGS